MQESWIWFVKESRASSQSHFGIDVIYVGYTHANNSLPETGNLASNIGCVHSLFHHPGLECRLFNTTWCWDVAKPSLFLILHFRRSCSQYLLYYTIDQIWLWRKYDTTTNRYIKTVSGQSVISDHALYYVWIKLNFHSTFAVFLQRQILGFCTISVSPGAAGTKAESNDQLFLLIHLLRCCCIPTDTYSSKDAIFEESGFLWCFSILCSTPIQRQEASWIL